MGSKVPSNVENKSSLDDLPPETVVEILLKLPVKFIIRSTLVSKTWHSLITNPNFISAQIKRSISCCDENAVLIVPPVIANKLCYLVSADTSSLIEKFEIPLIFIRFGRLHLVASLHGLLLLCFLNIHSYRFELYLWNPCIRRHRALASTNLYDTWSSKYYAVGLGFHKPTNDYRVVRIVYVSDQTRVFREIAPKAEIYSLREHTWKEIKDPKVPVLASANGAYVNGRFYWLGEKTISPIRTINDREQLWILSFDFDTEEFGEVLKLPDEVCNCLGKPAKCKLMEFEGSLCLCFFDGDDVNHRNKGPDKPSCMWLLRSENGVTSWTLRFRFLLKEGGRPMNVTKSGSLILESHHSRGTRSIISCNLKSMHYRDLGFCDVLDGEDTMSIVLNVVDTSFMDSLVMYEGKKYC